MNYRKDGSTFWKRSRIAPVKDADGNIGHYVAILHDLTARKQVEEALRAERGQVPPYRGDGERGSLVSWTPSNASPSSIGRRRTCWAVP